MHCAQGASTERTIGARRENIIESARVHLLSRDPVEAFNLKV
jgi:hypothetical protein